MEGGQIAGGDSGPEKNVFASTPHQGGGDVIGGGEENIYSMTRAFKLYSETLVRGEESEKKGIGETPIRRCALTQALSTNLCVSTTLGYG